MKAPSFLIAPDKFKGCIDAPTAAGAIRDGITSVLPEAPCTIMPLADGGEGTADVFLAQNLGTRIEADTCDALGRPVKASYVLLNDGATAVIETAAAAGLSAISPSDRSPLTATSEGVGLLIRHAVQHGAKKICLGLGGSATNDGGCGIARALGWRFLDADGREFPPLPRDLGRLTRLVPPPDTPAFECIALADVANPLLGPRGATRTYGPQKGATHRDLDHLERALESLAAVASDVLGRDFRETPGSGAAGGIGFGVLAFLGGTIVPGFQFLSEVCNFPAAIAACDWVVTGEGGFDLQSLEGKGPAALAQMAGKLGKPVILLAGSVQHSPVSRELFAFAASIQNRPMSLEESSAAAESLLRESAANVASLIRAGRRPVR